MLSPELPVWSHIQTFLWCVSTRHFLSVLHHLLPSFYCHFLVRARVSSDIGASRVVFCLLPLAQVLYELPPICHESLHVLRVTSVIHPGWQPSSLQEGRAINLTFVMQCILISGPSTLPFPPVLPIGRLWGLFPTFRGPIVCTPL